jgi:hypothetical protein
MIVASHLPTTCDIYRPYGAGSAVESGVRCRLIEQLDEGRAPVTSGSISWSHYMEVDSSVDIRDGVTRTAGALTYHFTEGDADEVRIPDVNGTRYIVVFVIPIAFGTRDFHKRVLLLRDDPVWNGTGWD